MSIYGEGLYRSAAGERMDDVTRPVQRDPRRLGPARARRGEADADGRRPRWKRPNLASVYALTKYVQERLTLTVAPAYGMQGVALRLFNVYGPGQALSNPYTGVLAIFASRLQNRQRADGLRGWRAAPRLRACRGRRAGVPAGARASACARVRYSTSAAARDVSDAAGRRGLAAAMGVPHLAPEVTGQGRGPATSGTVSPTSRWRGDVLGFQPRRGFDDGLGELAEWVQAQQAEDRVARRTARTRAAGARGMKPQRPMQPEGDGRPVLVTGGAGFIGSNLADRLAGLGRQVIVFDALTRPGVERNLDWLRAPARSAHPARHRRPARPRAARPRGRRAPARCSTWPRKSR